jgi:nucleoside 2-deoxyribosyltransferase
MPTAVYVASPLGFASGMSGYGLYVKEKLLNSGHRVLDPWAQDYSRAFTEMESQYSVAYRRRSARELAERIGEENEKLIREATHVLGIVDGMEPDSGTVSEMAFGYGIGKRVYGLRTDLRDAGDFFGVPLNLQVMHWIRASGGKLFRSIAKIDLA